MSPAPRTRPFVQVNVFSRKPSPGNPVAVVLDGTDLTADGTARFARWTTLSETTPMPPRIHSSEDQDSEPLALPAGTRKERYGLVTVTPDGDHVSVGGHRTACIDGTVLL